MIIRDVQYLDWLANGIVAKKKNDKNQVCIDFIELNKVFPNDGYLLPVIDMLVYATAWKVMMRFVDAFSSYNQILMHTNDKKKTSFITERGILLQGHAIRAE